MVLKSWLFCKRARAHGSQKWPMKGGWGQQGEREGGMLTLWIGWAEMGLRVPLFFFVVVLLHTLGVLFWHHPLAYLLLFQMEERWHGITKEVLALFWWRVSIHEVLSKVKSWLKKKEGVAQISKYGLPPVWQIGPFVKPASEWQGQTYQGVMTLQDQNIRQVQGGFVNDKACLGARCGRSCQLTNGPQASTGSLLSMTKLFWARCRRVLSIDKMGHGQVLKYREPFCQWQNSFGPGVRGFLSLDKMGLGKYKEHFVNDKTVLGPA